VPFVHQSFSPFRTHPWPSGAGSIVVDRRAGSDPTRSSVSAKPDNAPAAQRGRNRLFCSAVPKSLSGWGTPIDWCARATRRGPVQAPHELHDPAVLELGEAEPAVLRRDLHPERTHPRQAFHDLLRVLPRRVDRHGVHALPQERPERLVEPHELGPAVPSGRERVDQVETEVAEEHLLDDARRLPFLLAGGLGDLQGLALAGRDRAIVLRLMVDLSAIRPGGHSIAGHRAAGPAAADRGAATAERPPCRRSRGSGHELAPVRVELVPLGDPQRSARRPDPISARNAPR